MVGLMPKKARVSYGWRQVSRAVLALLRWLPAMAARSWASSVLSAACARPARPPASRAARMNRFIVSSPGSIAIAECLCLPAIIGNALLIVKLRLVQTQRRGFDIKAPIATPIATPGPMPRARLPIAMPMPHPMATPRQIPTPMNLLPFLSGVSLMAPFYLEVERPLPAIHKLAPQHHLQVVVMASQHTRDGDHFLAPLAATRRRWRRGHSRRRSGRCARANGASPRESPASWFRRTLLPRTDAACRSCAMRAVYRRGCPASAMVAMSRQNGLSRRSVRQ